MLVSTFMDQRHEDWGPKAVRERSPVRAVIGDPGQVPNGARSKDQQNKPKSESMTSGVSG